MILRFFSSLVDSMVLDASPVLWNVENCAKKGCFTYFCTLPGHDQTLPCSLLYTETATEGIYKSFKTVSHWDKSLKSCSRALTGQRQDSSWVQTGFRGHPVTADQVLRQPSPHYHLFSIDNSSSSPSDHLSRTCSLTCHVLDTRHPAVASRTSDQEDWHGPQKLAWRFPSQVKENNKSRGR